MSDNQYLDDNIYAQWCMELKFVYLCQTIAILL